jgi:hypothetical protein
MRQGYQTVPDKSSNRVLGTASNQSSNNAATSTQISSDLRGTSEKKVNSKIMITGDDILIEYVARLVKVIH